MSHDPNRLEPESRLERASSVSTGFLFITILAVGVLVSAAGLEQPAAAHDRPVPAVVAASETPAPNPAPAPETENIGCGCDEACLVQSR